MYLNESVARVIGFCQYVEDSKIDVDRFLRRIRNFINAYHILWIEKSVSR